MRRLVVTTGLGAFITEKDVEDHDLVGEVAGYVRMFPAGAFYLDGQLVEAATVDAIKAALSSGVAAELVGQPPAAPPEPEKVQDYNETLQRVFADVRKHHVEVLRDMAECTRMVGRVLVERERDFADEAARQRELTRKSLADVDLLGRCVKVTEYNNNVLARVGANNEARARGDLGMTFRDLFGGFTRIFTGER
jgi:hypothetical protein